MPPSASISRTKLDLAGPPTAGLQGISAIFSMFSVISATLEPNLEAATAASTPAWPAPTTIQSNLNIFI